MRYLNKPIDGEGVPSLTYVTVADTELLVGMVLSTVRTELETAFRVNLH